MNKRLFPLFWCLVFLFFTAMPTMEKTLNPHIRPEPCLSCHTKVPTEAEAQAGNYFTIKKTIDETCRICHPCCQVGTKHHGTSHPSNIADWDRNRFQTPKTLPLHNGRITCNTCHLHLVTDEPTIHLLRKVQVGNDFNLVAM
jgi:hypothetical protein